jgi:hypothetical protein
VLSMKSFVTTPANEPPPLGIEAHDSEVRALIQIRFTLGQRCEVISDRRLPRMRGELGVVLVLLCC